MENQHGVIMTITQKMVSYMENLNFETLLNKGRLQNLKGIEFFTYSNL